MNKLMRIFGSGPIGLIVSLLLLLLAFYLKDRAGLPSIGDDFNIRLYIFLSLTIVSVVLIIWSFRSLNPKLRGVKLSTTGAFKYFRHPLYAAFLTFFDFGLAVILNNWIFIGWALVLHPIWHGLVRPEEGMLRRTFSSEYEEYCRITGRFIPKIYIKK